MLPATAKTALIGLASLIVFLPAFLQAAPQTGYSVGLFESSAGDNAGSITMVQPRIFGNVKNGKSQMKFDYIFGYRSNNRNRELHSSEHSATLNVDRRLSRNTSLELSENFRSVFNDYGVL